MALLAEVSGRRRAGRALFAAIAGCWLLSLAAAPLHAQPVPGAATGQPGPAQLPSAAPAPESSAKLPGTEQLVAMVRNVLISVNDANLTGNYAVLQGLTAPDSQKFNTVSSLEASFGPIRQQGTDLAIVAVATPQFRQLPALAANGLLRANGEFITNPRITFDLFFQNVGGRWRPFAIGIGVVPVPPAPQTPPNTAAKAAPAKKFRSQTQPH